MTSSTLASHQTKFIEQAMSVGALKFGSFTLNSGRTSPYFFLSSLICSGPVISTVSTAYAVTIAESFLNPADKSPQFDVLFGPAYKGIPFAASAALCLYTQYNVTVGFAYDRKEVKDHGEGGKMVGVSVDGKRVLILDDVMTTGKAVHTAIETVRQHGGEVVGVVQILDREEVGKDGVSSTVKDVEQQVGKGRVKSILKMRDLLGWLEKNGMTKELESMKEYWDKYGLK